MLHSGAVVAQTMAAAELQRCNMYLQASSCSFLEVLSSQKWLSGVVYTYISVKILFLKSRYTNVRIIIIIIIIGEYEVNRN